MTALRFTRHQSKRFLMGFDPGSRTFLLFLEEKQSPTGNHRVLLRIELTLFHDLLSNTSTSIQRRRLPMFSFDRTLMWLERTAHPNTLAVHVHCRSISASVDDESEARRFRWLCHPWTTHHRTADEENQESVIHYHRAETEQC